MVFGRLHGGGSGASPIRTDSEGGKHEENGDPGRRRRGGYLRCRWPKRLVRRRPVAICDGLPHWVQRPEHGLADHVAEGVRTEISRRKNQVLINNGLFRAETHPAARAGY